MEATTEAKRPKGEATGAAKEHLSDLTVDVVLALRGQYLATGANALGHWDDLANAMKSATRTSTGPEEWLTSMSRRLRIVSPSRELSQASEVLTEAVRRHDVRAWLALVEREHFAMIARARRLAEERREARIAAQQSADTTTGTET